MGQSIPHQDLPDPNCARGLYEVHEKDSEASNTSPALDSNAFHAQARLTSENDSPRTDEHNKGGFRTISRSFSMVSSIGFPGSEGGVHSVWKPSFLRPSPLFGLASLLLATSCLFASLAVLLAADGSTVDSWTWQPEVFLAITTAVANSSIHFALLHALPTAWWYRMLKGSKIRDLQRQWEAGQSVFRAIAHGRHLSLLMVACISSALVLLDGPLLQKATKVVPSTHIDAINFTLPLAQELPRGFAGNMSFGTHILTYESDPEQQVDAQWRTQAPIITHAVNCPSTCYATVRGPGIRKTDCTTNYWPVTNETFYNQSATWGSGGRMGATPLFETMFTINNPDAGYPQNVSLTVGRMLLETCDGQYVETNCTLSSVIKEYEIMIKGQEMFLTASSATSSIVAVANNTVYGDDIVGDYALSYPDTFGQTLRGIIAANVSVNGSLTAVGGQPWLSLETTTANSIFIGYQNVTAGLSNPQLNAECIWTGGFRDPTDDIISQIDNFFFRAGLASVAMVEQNASLIDPGLPINQTLAGRQVTVRNTYVSDLRWWAGAAAIEMLAILAILPVFWGWWKLGIRMTFSPFEVAHLFGAPIFKDVPTTADARGLVNEVGDINVKLKVVDEEHLAVEVY